MKNYRKVSIILVCLMVISLSVFGNTVISTVIAQADGTLGNATSIANSYITSIGEDAVTISDTIAVSRAQLGNALAIANTDITTLGDAVTLSKNLVSAEASLGDAIAIGKVKIVNYDSTVLATTLSAAKTAIGMANSYAENIILALK